MNDQPHEADRAPGAPHPRETVRLIGQDAAERGFLEAFNSGRLHHAWLISGPRGVGKATLAWRIARFLLSTPTEDDGMFGAPPPPETLATDANSPIAHRISALSEPRLFLLRRPWDEKTERLKQNITVNEVRRMKGFFSLSASDGGRRVVIVDAADDMNVNAANALLKLLEEPPADTVMLLISHQPSRLPPTILSRCRTLRCQSLSPDDMSAALAQTGVEPGSGTDGLSALAAGSVGAALRLITLDGLAIYQQIIQIYADRTNRQTALKLAESATGRANAERFELMLELFDLFLSRLPRTGISGPPQPPATPDEPAILARLAPHAHASRQWADLHQQLGARARHGRTVNLDPAALILDMVLKLNDTAAELAA